MDYSNMEMVSNVAIPYTPKVGDSNVQQEEMMQHNLTTTAHTTLQDEKSTRNSTPVTQTSQYSQISYQEEPVTYSTSFFHDL